VDVVEGLRAFQAVAVEQSFTRAAERCGVPQPVVSRRVAALERHLGSLLLERTSRSVSVTPFGARVLSHAIELLAQWELIESTAREDGARLLVSVPPRLDPRVLASIRRGLSRIPVRFTEAGRADRLQAWRSRRVDVALLVTATAAGTLDVPLGLGQSDETGSRGDFPLSRLRRPLRERDRPPRVLHLQEEDDVPAIRDPLTRLAYAHGLRRDQVEIGIDRTEALTRVHEFGDVIVCPAAEASHAGLDWRPVRGLALTRSYHLVHRTGLLTDAETADLRVRLVRAVTGSRR